MAALVTRGCSEMRRVVVMMGGEPSTVFGLSGVGDTFGTCFGPLSRNRQVGIRLGQGENIDDILAGTTEVAEGVATSRALKRLLDKKVRGDEGASTRRGPDTHTTLSRRPSRTYPPTRSAPLFQVKGFRKDLKYPIIYGVAAILDGELEPRDALNALMVDYPLRLEDFSPTKEAFCPVE